MGIVAALVALARYTADVGHQIAVALVAAGGGQVVQGPLGDQGHQGVHQGRLAAAGLADDGCALGIDADAMQTVEGAPVEDLQLFDDIGSSSGLGVRTEQVADYAVDGRVGAAIEGEGRLLHGQGRRLSIATTLHYDTPYIGMN